MKNNKFTKLTGLALAIENGAIAVYMMVIYGLASKSQDIALAPWIALAGWAAVAYYLTLHRYFKQANWSALILFFISIATLGTLVATTGGLGSVYFGIWLLMIALSGLAGREYTIALTTILVGYLGYMVLNQPSEYFFSILPAVLISILAVGIARWLRQNITAPAPVASTPLTGAAITSEVLMNSMGDGVIMLDDDLNIKLMNPVAQELTGWDNDTAIGLGYKTVLALKLADGKDISDEKNPLVQTLKNGEDNAASDLVLSSKNGRQQSVSITASSIKDKSTSGIIAVIRDISTNKQNEKQRSDFISTASHEMRTPIAAIEGYLSLALNAQVATIDDRARGYLMKAHESTQHLGQLFKDLLSVSKLEDQQISSHPEVFDVASIASKTVEDMQFNAATKNLKLLFNAGEEQMSRNAISPIYYCKADKERIREAISNLIENAIKFSEHGSISVTVEGDKKTITVSVKDTGPGIAPEDVPHLFQKFYRIDNSATRTVGGTGLGLYLVKKIVELYDGKIWVDSKLGEGSAFKFSLPRLSPEQAEYATNEIARTVEPVAS